MPRQGLDTGRVVGAAVALADAQGLEAVTLAAVAASLDVRPPSLYNHVAGRDGLLRAIALRALRELAAAMRDASVGRAGPDALTAAARAYRAYAHAHPGRYAATLHGFVALEAAGGFELPVDLETSFDRLVATVAAGL